MRKLGRKVVKAVVVALEDIFDAGDGADYHHAQCRRLLLVGLQR